MHNSKLFQLLRTLEASEIPWLHKFLKSPYYNSNPQYLQLFEYIRKYYPNLEHAKLSKEIVFKKLYPKETFTPQKMRKLMHELATLVEEFLVVHSIKNNRFEHRKRLIAELGRRNHYKAFEKETNSLLQSLEQQEKRDENHFLERYQLRKQLFAHPLTERGREGKDKLLKISEELDYFFFLQKLNLDTALESNARVFAADSRVNLIDEINVQIKNQNSILPKELLLHQLINELLRENKKDDFFDHVFEQYKQIKNQLTLKSKSDIIQSLISFTSLKLNQGKTEYVSKQLALYKTGLADKVLLRNQKMTNNTFSNIISCAAFEEEYDWAEWFLETYKNYLEISGREEIVTFNKANINFKKGNFLLALNHLSSIHFDSILYRINSKVLLIECYFELFLNDDTYFELLMAQSKAFEKFIRREKNLTKEKKQQLLNFTFIVKKLAKSSYGFSPIEPIIKEISDTKNIAVKSWIMQKINSLKTEST